MAWLKSAAMILNAKAPRAGRHRVVSALQIFVVVASAVTWEVEVRWCWTMVSPQDWNVTMESWPDGIAEDLGALLFCRSSVAGRISVAEMIAVTMHFHLHFCLRWLAEGKAGGQRPWLSGDEENERKVGILLKTPWWRA